MATTKKAATKPVTAKAAAPKAVGKAVKPTKSTVAAPLPAAAKPRAPAKKKAPAVTAGKPLAQEQRTHYIEVAAFYIAERRGFAPGNPLEDWIAAEAEIDRLLATGHLG